MKPSYPKTYSGATRKRLSQSEYYKLYPKAKKSVQNKVKKNQEQVDYNKKTYSKEYKELKFLVETKKADDFTVNMYVAIVSGRKITPKMLNAIHRIMKRTSPDELEKRRIETGRLLSKLSLVKEELYKCKYDSYYESRSEDFLDSIEKQIRDRATLSSKQKLALNKMYKRFKKKVINNDKTKTS
jgi:hypothetical protein